jgi:hypothetical protein
MSSRGTKIGLALAGGITLAVGAAKWNNEFGDAESLRGRDPAVSFAKIGHWIGDLPDIADAALFPVPSDQQEQHIPDALGATIWLVATSAIGSVAIGSSLKREGH